MEKENEKAKTFCMDRLDCSKYHLNSTEPHQIKIPCIEEADTKIKVEKSEDIQSTIDYEYEYESQKLTLAGNMVSSDCGLISKIEIKEDLVIKTESSDLSEFIEQCHNKDISSSMEPEFIEISGMDVADTVIKIEDDTDPLSFTHSHDFYDFYGLVWVTND